MCGSSSAGSSSGTICQSSLPLTICPPESWTQTTGTPPWRAFSTRLPMLATTAARSWAPSTTPFWTSTTRTAVFGRFSSVVIVAPPVRPSVDPREARREQRRPEVDRRRVIERLEQALRRRDLVPIGGDVAAQRRPERRRAHLPSRGVEQVAALDVDLFVIAGRGVLVDR